MRALAVQTELIERTLVLAEKGWGATHPNPMVGALIEEGGEVVAEGYHSRAGSPHAEVEAFSALGRKPRDAAVLYVSLEPCSSTGRTPACTSAILQSGIRRVVVGCIDPDSRHAGHGLEVLRAGGVDVVIAPSELEEKATRLNFIFNHRAHFKSPLIALKMALSANGMVAERAGYPSRVTGEKARADVMRWRRLFPSICVGSGTIVADDPSLTSRISNGEWCPLRLVVDSSLSTLSASFHPRRVYTDEHADKTIILTTPRGLEDGKSLSRADELGIRVVEAESGPDGRVSPLAIRKVLEEFHMVGTYCEGGPALARSLLYAKEVDYMFFYRSSKTFHSPEAMYGPDLQSLEIKKAQHCQFEEDQLIHGFL